VTAHPEYGLPFGQDRIVPIFLATLAVRQQSQTIRFRSAAEMLETFGLQKGGKQYRRLVAAFERVIYYAEIVRIEIDCVQFKAQTYEVHNVMFFDRK
jgi:hypothetical protein